jgi:TorA maturation chaperone TorD
MSGEIDVEQLKIEFSKLFVGPFKLLAPPYGSVYLEPGRRVMGDSTIDARNWYREAGLDFSDNLKEAPDHITIELEFVYYLIYKELEAIANSDGEAALATLNKRKGFLVNHLGAWVSGFADKVEENAETDFYKDLARLTNAFVQKDKAEITKVSFAELVESQQAD